MKAIVKNFTLVELVVAVTSIVIGLVIPGLLIYVICHFLARIW